MLQSPTYLLFNTKNENPMQKPLQKKYCQDLVKLYPDMFPAEVIKESCEPKPKTSNNGGAKKRNVKMQQKLELLKRQLNFDETKVHVEVN